MAIQSKIDSNVTGLRYTKEESLGTLAEAGKKKWKKLEPNSYSDFGGQYVKMARNPISADRQRKKGVLVDGKAAGGFNTDVTSSNLRDILQGFFFADERNKPDAVRYNDATDDAAKKEKGYKGYYEFVAGKCTVDVDDGPLPRLKYTEPADVTDLVKIVPGEWVFVGGDKAANKFTNSVNNGFKRVREVTDAYIEFDKSEGEMEAEGDSGAAISLRLYLGTVLKNEVGAKIVRKTYQLERTLGAPDSSHLEKVQAEYLEGAVPSELSLNVPSAEKITADLSFMATKHTVIKSDGVIKSKITGSAGGEQEKLLEEDAFNTSSDFSRIKLSAVKSDDEAPKPLFAFAQEMTVTLSNNLTVNNAVGVFGSFEVTAGTFETGGSIRAYFADVDAVQAIADNGDVTLDMIAVNNGKNETTVDDVTENIKKGIAVDIPLITLGNGQLNVEQDSPITLPLDMEAADASKISSDLDHTLLVVFFDVLPSSAAN